MGLRREGGLFRSASAVMPGSSRHPPFRTPIGRWRRGTVDPGTSPGWRRR